MISIVQRYLALEILKTTAATSLILFTILMSNTLGSVLSDVSNGETPIEALIPVLLGQSIQVLSVVLSLSFFLGVVFALGRLYKDHELIVLQACGYGYRQLYVPMLIVLIPVFLITAMCSLWLGAEMLQRAKLIIDEKNSAHEIQRMKVGQFNLSKDKQHVFFMQSISDDKLEIRDVIVTQKTKNQNVIETAKRGRNKLDEKTGDLFLELSPGKRYEGVAGQGDYRIIDFEKHGILMERKQTRISPIKVKEKSLQDIIYSNKREDRVEFLWRVTIPLTVVILGFLSIPLAYIAPRQGRYGKIGVALLVFIVYLNLLGLTKTALNRENLPLWLNFWWVHSIFIVLTLIMLKRRVGQLWNGNKA